MIIVSARHLFALLIVGSATLACSSSGDPPSPSGASSSSTSSASSSTSSGSTSSSTSSASSSSGGSVSGDGVPSGDPAAMNAWLQKKEYEAWPKDSGPRPFETGAGGHSGTVRTYLSPILDASMKTDAAEHPVGAATVKEFFNGTTLRGWAVYVKTQAASDGGKGWYWYEVLNTAPGADPLSEGQGDSTCTGCHSAGRDFVRTPYPLK